MMLYPFFVVLLVSKITAEEKLWWRNGVFYQVYPRSFKDSNGDGIGDLKGITQKASYFNEIGVDAIWLNPINKSPMRDFGYDIYDFTTIETIFGTMQDFEELMATLEAKGIKLVLDFVPNHTSDQHIWFQASSNPSHPLYQYYKDFYVWKPANGTTSDGKPIPPNNWLSVFGGSAWEWCEERQLFYLHQFLKEQPDLDYRNQNVVSNMTEILNFWLDKGVDGFRMDAMKFLVENVTFANELPVPGTDGSSYDTLQHNYDNDQPETYELLNYWTDVVHDRSVKDGRERALFSEVYDPINLIMKYYGTGNRTMQIPFNFYLLFGSLFSRPADLKKHIDIWMDNMPSDAVPNWVVGNHDNGRIANVYSPEMVDAVTLLTGTLPGVKCVYYGEEIGMENTFILWNQTVDAKGKALGPDHYFELSRDPERTPMQWDNSTSAGFSTNKTTWLPVNPNYWWLNVAKQRSAPASHLKVFQEMNKARQDPVLLRGDLKTIVPDPDTLMLIRSYKGSYYVLVINMGSEISTYTSQSLFGLYGVDMDMTVVVTSTNSGYSPGFNMRKGFLAVTLRPKAAILLCSNCTIPMRSANSPSSAPAASLVLLFCTSLALTVLGWWKGLS